MSAAQTDPRSRGTFRRRLMDLAPLMIVGALALHAVAAAGWYGYRHSFDQAVEEIRGRASHRLDLYTASFEREIEKYAAFPFVMSYDRTLSDLVAAPDDARQLAAADHYLERLNARIGTLAVYVLDKTGRCIASSNWNKADSFVGRDLSYRPYYRNVGIDHVERFYGIGTTNNEPGYFLSTAIHENGEVRGIGVVKVGLEQLERSWASAEAPVLVADEHGVVVLTSIPAWKYQTLGTLSSVERAAIAEAQQYNGRPLTPIGMKVTRRLDDANTIVTLPQSVPGTGGGSAEVVFLAQTRPMSGTPWHLTVLSDLTEAVGMARNRSALSVLAALLVVGALATFAQRQRHMRELIAARAQLQLAHDDLERTVGERTAALVTANARLQEEVAERARAERTLRDAQASLVQAGKLAVLGQLSAGIAHELNQPLAALATLSGNTVKFLDRDDPDTAKANLERIRQLVERMGRLTGELKSFARKSSGEAQAVSVRRSIDNALFLVNHRIERGAVTVSADIEEGASVWCDPNRLEQVLVNVMGNALDAMDGRADRRLELSVRRHDGETVIEIRDTGPGLTEELLAHVFEPFFTTKAPGAGLGLGLAISAGIIRDFGGRIAAENAEGGGARFTLTLPAGKKEDP